MMFRTGVAALVIAGLACDTATLAEEPTMNWDSWQEIAIQSGGRYKPLDTLAWETFRLTSNRLWIADLNAGRRLYSIEAYLTLLFDWSGWDHPQKDSLLTSKDWAVQYSYFHQADNWDKTPLIRVDYPDLKNMLGMPADATHIAPYFLATASVADPRTQQRVSFPTWGQLIWELKEADADLSPLEVKASELADRLYAYHHLRMGKSLQIVQSTPDGSTWLSAGELLLTEFNDQTDPSGKLRRAQQLLWDARAAFRGHDVKKFNDATASLLSVLMDLGTMESSGASRFKLAVEVAYNHWMPFRVAWIFMLLSTAAMLLYFGSQWRSLYTAAVGAYGLGLLLLVIGYVMRVVIAGRPPVTNMYESVIYVGLGVVLIGAVFEWIYRRQHVLAAAAAVSTVLLMLADNCPAVLDPSVRPLEPVLRSNFWLVTHVMTITLSYAAFALALGIANITLGYYAAKSENTETLRALSRFTYRATQLGVVLLASGIILGGVWADYSWGRFWGWDPKEVWALVALLGYLAVLHARFAGAVGQRGLAALTVLCFSLVVMAWYGVNFVLGAGLHSYGFGAGGQGYVYLAILLQWVFAGIALYRSRSAPAEVCKPDSLQSSIQTCTAS